MEVVEALAGMVSSMLEFPLVGFLGRLVPGGGSEAGKQVATAVGTGLDNLGSLCSQAGLDRWELLGLAVLSAITVYRKELSSNSVYNGKGAGSDESDGRLPQHRVPVVTHIEGCQAAADAAGTEVGAAGVACNCASMRARQQQRASAARRDRASAEERKLRRLVEGRIRSLDLPVNHLQQLRASVDASWSSFSTAWDARRARGGSGASASSDGRGDDDGEEPRLPRPRRTANDHLVGLPPCSHASTSRTTTPPGPSAEGGGRDQQGGGGEFECVECAAIAAARLAAASILLNRDGTVGLREEDDAWACSPLGALPGDALDKSLGFLRPQDLLALAQASTGAREAADSELVWREAWVTRFGAMWDSDVCRRAAKRWHLHGWDPKSSAVPQGWKTFFFEFEASWLEWVAAGQNSETSCLVGLHGRLYDITEFMHSHPGSPETLMDNAGADATEMFEDVGHSFDARNLMKAVDSLAPGPSARALRTSERSNGESSRGPCVLSSTAQRIRRGRALALREGKALRAAATAAAAAAVAAGPAAENGVQQQQQQQPEQEFLCEDCEGAFEPSDFDGDGVAGRARRSVCSHASGTLRVFYSPMREEWGGFFSCCRKHVCLCLADA